MMSIPQDEMENPSGSCQSAFDRHSGQPWTGVQGKSRNPVGPASVPVGQASCLSDGLEARPTKTYEDTGATPLIGVRGDDLSSADRVKILPRAAGATS
jgi:hypothetical protein